MGAVATMAGAPARRTVRFFDRWWWVASLGVGAGVAYLNVDALGMQGVLPDYACFRDAIVAGMDPAANMCQSPTFPMWGYGWLLAVSSNEYALLLFQVAFATGAAWFLLRTLQSGDVVGARTARLVKLALLVSIPWYAASALRWPYTEAANLLLVSIALLIVALRRAELPYRLVALSGIVFGVALNFRSDYIALPVLVAVVVVAVSRRRARVARHLGVWLAAIVLTLIPWIVYGERATGHLLLTSTNSGHVLYISLGQLPDNPWGITPFDGDPRMHRELDAHFGTHVSSLTYRSDSFLRSRFVQLVRAHPVAWLRKDARNAAHTLVDGFYDGEFIQQDSCAARCWTRYGFSADGTSAERSRITTLFGASGLSAAERLRFGLLELGALEGRIVSFLGFLAACALLVVGLVRRRIPLALLALVPVYVLLMNTFTYELPSYSSNAYVFLIVMLGVAVAAAARYAHPPLSGFRARRRPRRRGPARVAPPG